MRAAGIYFVNVTAVGNREWRGPGDQIGDPAKHDNFACKNLWQGAKGSLKSSFCGTDAPPLFGRATPTRRQIYQDFQEGANLGGGGPFVSWAPVRPR